MNKGINIKKTIIRRILSREILSLSRLSSCLFGFKKFYLGLTLTLTLATFGEAAEAGVIPCSKIKMSGTFVLRIDDGIFSDFPQYAEAYFNKDYVRFSELFDTETRLVQFYPESNSETESPQTLIRTNVAHPEVNSMRASVESGRRGDFCTLEVTGQKSVDGKPVPFQEFYLILAANFKGENYYWLGLPNENQTLVAYYKLTRLTGVKTALR